MEIRRAVMTSFALAAILLIPVGAAQAAPAPANPVSQARQAAAGVWRPVRHPVTHSTQRARFSWSRQAAPATDAYALLDRDRPEMAGGHPEAGLPNSAKPCATAHGAHSGTFTSPFSPAASRRLITARLSHTPMSSGCDLAHTQPHSCWVQTSAMRQLSNAARTAGSLASLWNASLVR